MFKTEKGLVKLLKNQNIATEPSGQLKTFLDMIAPSVIKFNVDYFVCGNTFRCVWALREYPTVTEEQAILRHLGEKDGVTLRIFTRQVTPTEEKRIIHNATNKNRMNTANTNDLQESVTAESNLKDVVTLVSTMHRNREPLLHCAVYIELTASDYDNLKLLQTDVLTELVRSKLNIDRLLLRQQQGFFCVGPSGRNIFGSQFERVLPASSVANLYPFNYSGKTDSNGFYLGRDKFGSNILVDFDKRDDDKTNPCILILGNSGQGKSYLLKLILCNILESGKSVICLDPEHEFRELAENTGGCFVDLMSGQYMINPLEPKSWDDGGSPQDKDAPIAFRQATKLSQHISFLKDFFRCYKDFDDRHIDVIEIMLGKLYSNWNISDNTDFASLESRDYPILSSLYTLIEKEYKDYNKEKYQLYTAELLQEILLGLHSMCKGAESKFFNGHTNITSNRFIVFGVKGLLNASKNVKNALLFNVLSFMSDKLLTEGHTAAAIDELYLFLTNMTAIEYIRNFMKRVRKKESSVILSSQNLEDFNIEGIREMTKPLFSIPTHQFLFNAGAVDAKFYMDTLQLEESEYNLIKFPQRGVCLYKCGNERYNLMVHAPTHKERLFGKAGGR
ncbi:VirB4 family type IV secretion system protein [Anaerotignum sp.]|uniref:VirB4 family type IV secretion system protein n=1 Tax=Anaerotignum sp. TaxID=2039241 RepID=UPI002F4050F8